MKYSGKSQIVDAIVVKAFYKNLQEIIDFVGEKNVGPIERRMNYVLKIHTQSGYIPVSYRDWIIRHSDGSISVVEYNMFEDTYEQIVD